MLMTEEQALWTPCIGNDNCGRHVSTGRVPQSALDAGRDLTAMFGGRVVRRFCEGSACMAWRWSDPAEKHERRECETCGGTGGTEERACMDCEGEGVRLYPYPTPARRGYCGAFGKAEG